MDLLINNQKYSVNVSPEESLLNVLRNDLDLTGSKYGCGEGSCGACTVLINDVAVRSCTIKAGSVTGKNITTIEGLEKNGNLHPVQQAFLDVDVFQCAYCAPGMVMSAVSLLKKNTAPTEPDIIRSMQGNICRCGTYPRIIKAIQKAANIQKG
jgi:aerobic-type carbon monoxide dehydrogenase small subunit (CoxS/CutS family)